MYDVNIELVQTNVTCIKLKDNKIFAGIGGCMHIFDKYTRKLENIIKVFEGQKIYGIIPNSTSTQYLIYGGQHIKIYDTNASLHFKETILHKCDDWILEAKWIDCDEKIATISMHNIIILWTNQMKFIQKVICEEKCILYSAHLVNDTWSDLVVLSGTVFSQVLIWWPKKSEGKDLCSVLCKLDGHKGVIFSIHYNSKARLICSTSDDRSAIIWSVASGDLIRELLQSEIHIHQRLSLFGHTARVFKCKVLNNNILTAGEDSLINIWNFDGLLLRKIEAHQGASVWSFDSDENNNMIVSGGGDCGVTIFSLNQNILKSKINMCENPKRIVILQSNDLVTISEKGLLEYYHRNRNEKIEIARHDDLISYVLLEVAPCRSLIALAGYHGTFHIYKQVNDTLELYCSHQFEEKSRIFAFHWLSSESYLICGPEGSLSLWNLKEGNTSCIRIFNLPPSKERWTTAACMWENKYIATGDRKGNIYLYSVDSRDPIQTIKKAHNYLGVTNLYFQRYELLSLGRNSILKRYSFNASNEHLSLLSSDKLPFAWLATLNETGNTTLLLSFLGDEFVLWDYNKRRTLSQFPCGGGHRSWDFYKNNNDLFFVYVKDKLVHSIHFSWDALYPLDVISGYHVNEINTACCLNTSQHINGCLFVSGGEDTMLRISTIGFRNNFVDLRPSTVLKSHLSNIRTVSVHKITKLVNCESQEETYLIFSAGGRAQIIVWELQVNHSTDDTTLIKCSEKYSYYEQMKNEDSENRIMDLCVICIKEYVILVAACSDGTLKVFLVLKSDDTKDVYKITLVKDIPYKLKCILKVSHLEICNRNILLSMATDGRIVFWDVTNLLINIICLDIQNKIIDEHVLKEKISDFNLKPLNFINAHQSGINSFAYKTINSNQCIFLSGGDDNAVTVKLVEFTEQQFIDVKVLSTFTDITSHCAQITGVLLFNDHFLTTSIDQKLNVFKWDVKKEQLNCMQMKTHNLDISDIHGMQWFRKDNNVYVVVFGEGVQVCKIEIDDSCNS